MHKLFLSAVLLFIITLPAYGQGNSFSEYYSPKEYGIENDPGHPQNWEVAVDQYGILHIGNGNGLLSYNGVDWIDNHIGESGRAFTIYRSSNDVLYVAGSTNFGKIVSDSLNRITYESISDRFYEPNIQHPFVWDIHESNGNIYFSHINGIGHFDPQSNTYSDFELDDTPISRTSFQIGPVIYKDGASGLWAFKDSIYSRVAGTELFSDQDTQFAVELMSGKFLLGSLASGSEGQVSRLWVFDGKTVQPFDTPASDYLRDKFVFDAVKVDEQTVAIATVYAGVVFINEEGEIVRILNESTGLYTNEVYDLFIDDEENLWMGLGEGIQKQNLNSNIISYPEWSGIEGSVTDIALSENELYVYAFPYVYNKTLMLPENVHVFEKLESVSGSFNLQAWNNEVYAYGRSGIQRLRGDSEPEWIYKGPIYEVIEGLSPSGNLSFIGPDQLINMDENGAIKESSIKLNEFIDNAAWYKDDIYVTSRNNSRFKSVKRIGENGLEIVSIMYDTTSIFNINRLGLLNGNLYLAGEGTGTGSNGGLYEYDSERDRFIKSSFMAQDEDLKNKQVFNFKQCSDTEIWFIANKKTFRVKNMDGVWKSQKSPYKPLNNATSYSMECASSGVWLGRVNEAIYVSGEEWEYQNTFNTTLAGVYIERDSLIYGGYDKLDHSMQLRYKDNELRFRYAATSYLRPEDNEFKVLLEGFDSEWSDWNTENQKDYTNIPEGSYTFRVKSRNVYDAEGEEATFSFVILPPWYRTWWAYLLYFLTITGSLYLAYRIRINQLLRVQGIRNNIASDLHDEVSATLSSISYFAQAIKNEDMKGDKIRFVNLIANSAGDAKEKITDIVWAINPEHDNWEAFMSKCRRFASDLLESKDMKYNLNIDENIPGKLDMQLRQHLWLIFKEMITNAVRHSEASQVDVIFSYKDGNLKLIVQDNGSGMDVDKVNKGNGLVNIHNRADLIRAKIALKTSEGFGTRWSLNVPV